MAHSHIDQTPHLMTAVTGLLLLLEKQLLDQQKN